MSVKTIQYQHFCIELILGSVMLYGMMTSSIERSIITAALLFVLVTMSQQIRNSRIAAYHKTLAQQKKETERRAKFEAFRRAQVESAKKYLGG